MHAFKVLLAVSLLVVAAAVAASAADSDPLPVPKGGPRAKAVMAYNEGVGLMVERRFAEAQARFEAALTHDETLAEAHNNLAYSLRHQGATHYARALAHYNRALELNPKLLRATMYRGVLYARMGQLDLARAEHARLIPLDAELAARLDEVIRKLTPEDGGAGLSPQFE